MSFDWVQYLNLAGELCAIPVPPGSTEARRRSAISRAYYAAFHAARLHLRDKDHDPNIPADARVHTYGRTQFRESHNRARRRIGENLNRLRLDRNKADYDDVVPGLPALSLLALRLAEQVFTVLRRL